MTSNIKDVARRAGVSTATVSHVINQTRPVSEETRRKVENAIRGLNYQPNEFARTLRNKKSKIIDIFVYRETEPAFVALSHGCLERLTTRLNELAFMVNIRFFSHENECIAESNPCILITSQPVINNKKQSHMTILSLSPKIQKNTVSTIHLIDSYYHSIVQMIENHPKTRFIMSYQQGEHIKRLYSKNPNYQDIFQSIRLYNSEISSLLLEDLSTTNATDMAMHPKLCIFDYFIALGMIKKLLVQPEILSNIEQIAYYGYGTILETFGLPIKMYPFSVDPSIYKIVSSLL